MNPPDINFEEDPTWRRIKEWAEARMAEMRQKNDGKLGKEDTAYLRGQIAALKELQGLERQPIQGQKDSFAEMARDRPMISHG